MQNAFVAWPVLGTRLRQIVGASLHVRERRRRRIPARDAIETAAPFVRLATPRRLNRVHSPLEQRPRRLGDEIVVEERHLVVAGVALASDEPRGRVDRQPLGGKQLPHARIVGHVRECAGVGPAAAAAARSTVVRRFVRVVEADRSVSDHEHERREAIANADLFDDSTDDIRHLPHGEPGIPSDRRRFVFAIQLQPGSADAERRLVNAAPPRREPRKDHAQDERHESQPAERRHQHGAAHRQPASQMHVVAEEAGGAPVQAPRALHQAIPARFDFGDVVLGTDGHGTERPRMSVRHPLVIHRHVEEAGGAERLAGRLDLLQVAAKRFLPLIDAENRLERRRPALAPAVCGARARRTGDDGSLARTPGAGCGAGARRRAVAARIRARPRAVASTARRSTDRGRRAVRRGRAATPVRSPSGAMRQGADAGASPRSADTGPTERELSRGFVERGPFEQQADREVSAQRDREIPCRDAVGPLFDLPHDAGPASQGQQFGAQIVLALVVMNTELSEGVCDRVERAPFGGVVVGDEAGERSGPTAALRRQRRAVDLQKAAVNPQVPLGHGPVREALIEISSQESNERRMDPGIGVDAVHGEQPVAMANRSLLRGNAAGCRPVAPPRGTRSTTGAPPAVRRPRDRSVRAQRSTPIARSPAHRCGIAPTPRFLRGSTRARAPRRRECRAAPPRARDRAAIPRRRHPPPRSAPSCSTSSASTSLGRMRPDASLSRYRDSARYGSRPSRIAACSTASSNGRCSNACSVLW